MPVMQANSFQVFSFLLLEVYLSSEVAVCVWFFFLLFYVQWFFSLLMFPLKQFNILCLVQEVCLEDSQEYMFVWYRIMYGMRYHSLVCKLFMLLIMIFLEDRRTLVITGNVQNPFVWLPPCWYGEVGSDVRDCAYYGVYKHSIKLPIMLEPRHHQALDHQCETWQRVKCFVKYPSILASSGQNVQAVWKWLPIIADVWFIPIIYVWTWVSKYPCNETTKVCHGWNREIQREALVRQSLHRPD